MENNFKPSKYKAFLYFFVKTYSRKNKLYESEVMFIHDTYKRPFDLLHEYLIEQKLINDTTIIRYLFSGSLFCNLSLFGGINYFVFVYPANEDTNVQDFSFIHEIK